MAEKRSPKRQEPQKGPAPRYIAPTKRTEVRRTGDGQILVLNEDYPQPRYRIDDRRFTGPNGFRVELYYSTGTSLEKVDITEFVIDFSWTDSLEQASVEGTINIYDPVSPLQSPNVLAASPPEKIRRLVDIRKGSRLKISVINNDDKLEELGRFVVWEKTRNSRTDAVLSISFKDIMAYLHNSEDDWLFQKDPKKKAYKNGWTAKQITEYVCKRYGIPLNTRKKWVTRKVKDKKTKKLVNRRVQVTESDLPECKHRNPLVKISGGSVYELLLKVWTEERKVTGNKFIIRVENDRLKIIRKREQPVLWAVQEGDNIINTTFTDSLEGMATAVTVMSEPANNSSNNVTQSTDRTTPSNSTLREDTYPATGGGWKKEVASFFTVEDESGLACSGFEKNASLLGFGEAAKNMSASGPFNAMGSLPCGTVIEVRYKGKTMQLPKVDVGAGGSGIGSIPRVMDLTAAAWDALGINRSLGKVVVEWRLAGGSGTTAASIAKNNLTATAKNRAKIDKYGYLHKLVKVDKALTKKSARNQAAQILQSTLRENMTGSVTCFLMPRLRAGQPIFVRDDGARLIGKFYCSDLKHSISASGCTTDITLNWLDMVPSALLTDEDKGIKPANTPSSGSNCAAKAIEAGRAVIGTPYSWGGGGTNGASTGVGRGAGTVGFDCSGFIQYCWAKAGVSVPRHTDALAQVGSPVPKGQEQLGDILLYNTSDGAGSQYGHAAMWTGPGMILNSGGRAGGGVREYARSDHVLVRRVTQLCPNSSPGGAPAPVLPGPAPTTPTDNVVIQFDPQNYFLKDKERSSGASPGGTVYILTNFIGSGRRVYLTYNGKKVGPLTAKDWRPRSGVDIVVGPSTAATLGITKNAMQKLKAYVEYM